MLNQLPLHTHTHRPSLPSNIIALGDPKSIPDIMSLGGEDEKAEEKEKYDGIPTLSPEILADIWDNFVINSPSTPR